MKIKVIRSGDKNFEEEKIKMFEPRTLTKEEQLKLVFSKLFTALFLEYQFERNEIKLIEKYTNISMKEVKIRIKL